MTEPTPFLPLSEVQRFWQLQRVARKANLRLTTDGKRLHLRDDAGHDQQPADLDAAEQMLSAAIVGAVAAIDPREVHK